MAKDPAFLFYSNDFLTGTYLMTDEQVGKYIRLLCLQHQKGPLSEKDMLNICKSYDEDIFAKFEIIENKFINKRLYEESEKRKSYSESRKNNRKKKDMINISESYVQHMENENENEDVIINNKIIIKSKKFISSDFNELPEHYTKSIIEQFKIQKQKTITQKQITDIWEVFKIQNLTGEEFYTSENKVYQHFINWIKKQNFENGTNKPTAEEKFNFYKNYSDRFD